MNTSTEVISPSVVAADDVLANILIVDDRPDKLLVFKTILEDLEQNIITLQSGEEALRWLLENECAVMLLDVNMPGMDGFETANLIRGRRRSAHTPIIFITAHADEIHTAKGYSLGAVDYLLTPAAPNVLRSKVMVFVQLFNLTQQIKRQADEHVNLAREQAARAAAEELTRRASFLAEASKILISSLDVNSLMVGATRLVVPMLADFSAITLIDGEETLVRTASGHGGNLDALGNAVIQHPLWVAGANEVLATGRPKIIENFSGRDGAGVRDESAEEGKPPSGHWPIKHVAMLPLRARDKTYGVLAFALGPSGRRFSNLEIELASDITSRVAVALDNCLLFKEIQKADQRKNEFLATLSHELRNPLAPMRTAIHALHLSGLWPAGAQEMRAHTVADTARAQAPGFQHPFGGVGLARMQGDGQTGVTHQRQRSGMAGRRKTELRPGQVKAHHTLALVLQRQPGRTQRVFGRQVAHGADDQAAARAQTQGAAVQAGQQRFHGRLARHAVGLEEQRRDAELGQQRPVGVRVLGGLEGHAFHGRHAGHGGHRQREAFQVPFQAAGVGIRVEPGRQRGHVVLGRLQPALAQQRQQRGHAQAAVQVFVQQHLGQGAGTGEQVGRIGHATMLGPTGEDL